MVIYSINGCIFNTWAMALLAILLLGVGGFGVVASIASHNLFWLWVSAIGFLMGARIGLKCLENEGVDFSKNKNKSHTRCNTTAHKPKGSKE